MPKNNTNTIHAQRLKAIRPFIDFNYDLRKPLSKYQKAKIKTYYDEINALTARPYHVYRPRKSERLTKAQQFAQHEKQLKGLKVAFIPTNGIEKPKISFNKSGDLIAETKHVRTEFIPFEPNQLINDPETYARDLINDIDAKRFTILAGKYEIPNSYSKSRLPANVAKLAGKYGNPDLNNYFGNWMVGLSAHRFSEQESFNEYAKAKSDAKKQLQRERKNRKRRKSK